MNTHPPFSVSGGYLHCQAPTDITGTNEAPLRAQIEQAVSSAHSDWRVLLLNLEATRLIDSKGLNLIVSLVKSIRAGGHDIHLVNPQPAIRRILAFTRLDRHVTVVEAGGPHA